MRSFSCRSADGRAIMVLDGNGNSEEPRRSRFSSTASSGITLSRLFAVIH